MDKWVGPNILWKIPEQKYRLIMVSKLRRAFSVDDVRMLGKAVD
jgi:hypothetical protein